MIPNHARQSIFGEGGDSPIWASNLNGEGKRAVPFPHGHIVFLIPVSSALELHQSNKLNILESGNVAIIRSGPAKLEVTGAGPFDTLLVGIKRSLLIEMLESFRPGLRAEVRHLVFSEVEAAPAIVPVHELLPQRIVPALREPPVTGSARPFWFESQVKALLSLVCFVPSASGTEFFCTRQKRLALDRVAKAKVHLAARLDETLDLQGLASAVGCSPFYLSRTFTATTGMTITQFVRKLRIEKAADLLVTGRYNVSEAAIEVGYQSLSHFSKAFQQVKGCLPSKYEAA